ELSGWVSHHPDIAWASALALDPDGLVYEAGRVVGHGDCSAPLFRGVHPYTFGWFGGPLWYRNATAASPYAIAMDASAVGDAVAQLPDGCTSFATLCRMLVSTGRRGLVNPHARIHLRQSLEPTWPNDGALYKDDPYFNPVFRSVNPLSLLQ
ncbi:MAG: hypothetical protein M3Q51_01970, partial [Pseudomonadota bacterium]|nr:hypothetical protein [Pseudomonadota bacterium]